MPGTLKIAWQARLVEDSPVYTAIATTILNHCAISSVHLSIITTTHIMGLGWDIMGRCREVSHVMYIYFSPPQMGSVSWYGFIQVLDMTFPSSWVPQCDEYREKKNLRGETFYYTYVYLLDGISLHGCGVLYH